jgi:hypothetical protein
MVLNNGLFQMLQKVQMPYGGKRKMKPITFASWTRDVPALPRLLVSGTEIRKPRYDPHPEKSQTNNSTWRQGFFVIFNGGQYDYMPLWRDLDALSVLTREGPVFAIFESRGVPLGYWVATHPSLQEFQAQRVQVEAKNKFLARQQTKAI